MFLKLNGKEIEVENIFGEICYKGGIQRDSIKIIVTTKEYKFDGIKDIFSNMPSEFEILDNEKRTLGFHKNFTELGGIEYKSRVMNNVVEYYFEITMLSVTEFEKKLNEQKKENEDLKNKIETQNKAIAELTTLIATPVQKA